MMSKVGWTYPAALLGLDAAANFALALLLFGAWTPGYSQAANLVSELGTAVAPFALAFNLIGFVLPGLQIAALGAGLGMEFRHKGLPVWMPGLVMVSGAAWALLGLFPASSGLYPSPVTTVHNVLMLVSLGTFVLAALAWPYVAVRDAAWRSFITPSMMLGLATIASFALPSRIP
ncbi:MAG TPA: DUF998 domain-containing protein, partial [Caldilineaceae bacterium]|nr:DUF998 domain-containing protein [Caldilineaceae bacterium]